MSRQHRVLVVIKGLGLGGAETLITRSARHWDRDAFDYRVVFLLPWKDQLVPELKSMGIKTTCIGGARGSMVSAFNRIRELSSSVDLLHAHLPAAGVVTRAAASSPVVYTEHNLVSSYRPVTRLANRLSYKRNARVIAVSASVAEALAGYPGPKPRVIPNAISVDVDHKAAAASRNDLVGLSPMVVHVGNIRPHKGHHNLIEAARLIKARKPEVKLISIGGEKKAGDLARVTEAAARAGVGDVLRFLGRRDNAAELISAADVYVSPADVEGLPLSVLEAMKLRTAVVATAVGGIPSIIRDGETGLLVDPGDPAALAVGVLELLNDRDLADRLAGAAYDLVTREHGMASMVRATEDVYKEVLGAV